MQISLPTFVAPFPYIIACSSFVILSWLGCGGWLAAFAGMSPSSCLGGLVRTGMINVLFSVKKCL